MIKRYTPRRRPTDRDRLFVVANHNIHHDTLRVMSDTGEQIGVMSKSEALMAARNAEKDLVLVTDKADPPIAKIIDLSKYKYQLSQQKAQDRKNSQAQDIKEIRLTPFIDNNDLNSKIKKIEGFLKKGHKVRLTMEFRGRSITKKDIGEEVFAQVTEVVQELSTVELPAKMMGKKMMMQLMPIKKGK
jgi:translation initiation factor IF-3